MGKLSPEKWHRNIAENRSRIETSGLLGPVSQGMGRHTVQEGSVPAWYEEPVVQAGRSYARDTVDPHQKLAWVSILDVGLLDPIGFCLQ